MSYLEPAKLLQKLLLLHPTQFLGNREQGQICFPANLVPPCDLGKTPSRGGTEIRRLGFRLQLAGSEKVRSGGVSTLRTR